MTPRRPWRTCLILIAALSIECGASPAAELQGSKAVLRLLEESKAPSDKPEGKVEALFKDCSRFREERHSLPPAAAAKRWLALFDRFQGLSPEEHEEAQGSPAGYLIAESVLSSLPPPEAWKPLDALVRRRPAKAGEDQVETRLRVMTAFLAGDLKAARKGVEKLSALAEDMDGYERRGALESVERLKALLEEKESLPGDKAREFVRLVESGIGRGAYGRLMTIPNLAEALGPARAEEVLRKAFSLDEELMPPSDPETRRLGKRVLLSMAHELKRLPWGFVDELSDVGLYEALQERGKALKELRADSSREHGMDLDDPSIHQRSLYVMGLVARGDRAKAAAFLAESAKEERGLDAVPDESFRKMEAAGHAREFFEFIGEHLASRPSSPLWRSYARMGHQLGALDAVIGRIGRAMKAKGLPEGRKIELRGLHIDCLLAADKVPQALALLRSEARRRDPQTDARTREAARELQWKSMLRLTGIGLFLGDKAVEEEGFRWLAENASSAAAFCDYQGPNYAQLLLRARRFRDAESFHIGQVKAALSNPQEAEYRTAEPAEDLVLLYEETGRDQDVLELLQKFPHWGKKDAAALPPRLQKAAAAALAKQGRKDVAESLLKNALLEKPGDDALYSALRELRPEGLVPWLERLHAQNRFEERPLIWKARLLLDQGAAEEAARTARQAIEIDPSDGEQGRGDRMRAYAVLADALEKKGDAADAAFYRRVVSAIRMSEDADDLRRVGLADRAIALYGKSLEVFSDAYCIQSRLAVTLSGAGQDKEAAAHFARAFELMPDSFGRVESHCFGCEGVFQGEGAESIAEGVFLKAREKSPSKAQVHYLLGYLRDEQDRPDEAAESYWEAVRIDPDYMNAWAQLAQRDVHEKMSVKQKDLISMNLLRLGASRVSIPEIAGLDAPPLLWRTVREQQRARLTPAGRILPLEASAEQEETSSRRGFPIDDEERLRFDFDPGHAVMSHAVLRVLWGNSLR